MATSLNDLRKRRMTPDEAIDFEPIADSAPDTAEVEPEPAAPSADLYPVPPPAMFRDDDGENVDFCEAPDLEAIGNRLITDPAAGLGQLRNSAILYLWKKSSGTSGGNPILGALKRPTPLEAFFEKTDYVLWVSASRANEAKLSPRNMEAEIYHLLLHAEINEDGRPGLIAPDVKGFVKEFERYGPWREEQRALRKNFRQLSLLDPNDGETADVPDAEPGKNFDPADYEKDEDAEDEAGDESAE